MLNKISQFTIKLSSILFITLTIIKFTLFIYHSTRIYLSTNLFFNQTVTMLKQVFPESLVIIGSDPKFGTFQKHHYFQLF